MKNRAVFLMAMLVAVATSTVLLLLWSGTHRDDIVRSGKRAARDKVRLQLQWFAQAQFAGFYEAKASGYYDEEGLDVEIIQGGYDINPIQRLVSKTADLALATGDQALLALGAGRQVKALGTVFRTSVAAFMSKQDANVRSPRDLIGKKVGVYRGFDTENILLSLLRKHQVPLEAVTVMQAGPVQAFKTGEIDVFPVYVFNEPLLMREERIATSLLRPEDFGVNFYSDTIVCTATEWEARRDVLLRFVRASAKGWVRSDQAPADAIDHLFEAASNLAPSGRRHQEEMLAVARTYLRDGPDKTMFYMQRRTWEDMERALVDVGRLSEGNLVETLCDFEAVPEALGMKR